MVPPACMKKSSRSLLRTGAWKPLSPIPNRADRLRRSSSIWTYGGLGEELYDIARKVAVVGFYVVLPDLYYGQGRVGSIGYCMGGRHLMWVAGAYPERALLPERACMAPSWSQTETIPRTALPTGSDGAGIHFTLGAIWQDGTSWCTELYDQTQ